MAMTEELKIKISVDSKGAEQNAKKVKNSIKGIGDEGSKTGGKVGKLDEQMAALKGQLGNFKGAEAFKGMTAAAASAAAAVGTVVVAVAGLVGMTKNAIAVSKLGKEIAVSAQQTGMTTNAYQEWSYVLEKVGIEAGKLTDFVKALTQAQIQAVQGSEDTAMAFQTLGLSMEQVQSMDQSQLFDTTIQGLQGISNASLRNAIAFQIFGEDAVQLATLLNLTSGETQRLSQQSYLLGSVMNQATIQSSVKLQGAMGNLRGAFQGVKNTLAQAFLPTIIRVVQWITVLIAKINILLRTLFGMKGLSASTSVGGIGGGGGGGSTKNLDNFSNSLKDIQKNAGGAGGAAKNVSDAINKVGDKAKKSAGDMEKLKKMTMGFDELNIVRDMNKDKGAGLIPEMPELPDIGGAGGLGGDFGSIGGFDAGDIGGGLGDFELPGSEDIEEFSKFCDKYKNQIQDIATASLLGIGVLGAVIMLLHGNILGAIPFLALAGLGIAIGSVEGGTFDRLSDNLTKWWDEKIVPWWEDKVKPIFTKEFWVEKWENVKKWCSDKWNDIKDKLDEWWGKVKKWWEEKVKPIFTKEYWVKKWEQIKTSCSEKLDEIKDKITNWWEDKVKPWWDEKVKPVFTKEFWQEKWEAIKEKASEKLDEIKDKITKWWDEKVKPFWEDKIKPVFTKEFWQEKWETIKTKTKEKLDEIKEKISEWWDNKVKPFWDEKIKPVFTKEFWQEKWETVKTKTKEKLEEIKEKIREWWDNKVKPLWDEKIKPVFTAEFWREKWDTVKNKAKEKLEEIKKNISDWWGRVKSWWSTNIAKIFTADFWINKWENIKSGIRQGLENIKTIVWNKVEEIKNKILDLLHFKDNSGYDDPIPDPPRGGYRGNYVEALPFATGGIVTRSVFANIGEAGTEAVLPLENNTGWMDMLADRIAERQSTPSQVVLKIGEEEFAWATINGINNITKQTGGLQLAL